MKNFSLHILLAFLLILSFSLASAQSPKILSSISKNCLAPFEYDGKVRIASLESGEETELYRTFETGKTYKVMVLNMATNESLNFTVYNDSNQVIYINKDTAQCGAWIYEPDMSMYVKIVINPPMQKMSADIVFVVGSKRNKKH
jgi:hypothetical protein